MRMAARASAFVVLTVAALSAKAADQALGTGFSYQGQLRSSNLPVNATCDFQFSLWDSSSTGVQKGATQTVSSVAVTGGLFTTTLNGANEFGSSAFVGQARWLAVAVRCPAGAGGYTSLLPRTALGVSPFATYPVSSALVAFAQVATSLSSATTFNDPAYSAFGGTTSITVPVSGQYVINYGAKISVGSTTVMGGKGCLTIEVDAAPPSGGICSSQNTGGPTVGAHDADIKIYYINAGTHTVQFYGICQTSTTITAPWFTILRP